MSPKYRALDPTSQQIRLLNILPSKHKSTQLSCTLTYTTIGLEDAIYEALSYTWGYPEATKALVIDGEARKVTESLEAVLRRLRQTDQVRTLWTDAICVNQNDNEEKASQVSLMDSIYKNATQVVVWLGEPDQGNRSAMMSLKVKNFSFSNNLRIWRTQRKHGVQRGWQASNNAILTGEMDRATGEREAEFGVVAQLLDRPWWQRVWIVQEVILAKKVLVVCGPDEVPWDNIKQRLGVRMYGLKTSSGAHQPLRAYNGTVIDSKYQWPDTEYNLIDAMKSAWWSGAFSLNFYDLIYQFRRFNCTLPQDRIFAYLGLVSAEQRAGIRVDYKMSLTQLYSHVARSLIAAHKHLLVLNCRREPCTDRIQPQGTRLYSTLDQGRFVDPQATIVDGPTDKQRKGWIRLPVGWERTVDDDGIWFCDRNAGRRQRESPLKGQTFSPQRSETFQHVPPGWHKGWDSLGRVLYTYSADNTAEIMTLDLPTWVPNWNAYSTRDPEPLPILSDADSCYWASGKNCQVHFVPTSHPKSSIIGLKGMFFDTISTIASPWYPEADKMPISRNGVEILKEWQHLALTTPENCPYGSSESRANAFWRSHLADYAGDNALPEQDKVLFDAWCDHTGWTPKISDLEHTKLASLTQFAKLPSEDMALDEMFSHVYERLMNKEAPEHLRHVPGFIFNLIKDTFAQQRYLKDRYKEIRSRIYRASTNRAMFVTAKGFIGLAPWNAKEGDTIAVLMGGCTPFILRSLGDDFTLVGEAFVYGIMSGELFGYEMGHARLRDFSIV